MSHKALPKPDRVVHFESYSKGHPTPEKTGALMVFGDPSSKKMALLCGGWADDHKTFLPFGKKLAAKCGILVGVTCLPGYDDRPEDGVGWQTHPPEGFSLDEFARTLRAAARALKGISTCPGGKTELIGIFHDWGVAAGTIWMKELEEEGDAATITPDKIVYVDVLMGPPKWAKDDPVSPDAIQWPTFYCKLCNIYQPLTAISNTLYTYVSKYLGVTFFTLHTICLTVLRLGPTYDWDMTPHLPPYMRTLYMAFALRRIFSDYVFKGKLPADLHEDWKKTPILLLYGTQKRASFNDPISTALLERESTEKRSLCEAIGVEGGHWMYHTKEEECLGHVASFIEAENTFAA
jgi:pimeloyl-ACP methyl ester carboxylesterase